MPGPGRGRPRCAYQLCTHKVNSKTAHKFPVENPALLKQWIANMRGKYWRITPQSTLCSAHFDVSCFDQEAQIKPDAIPTLFCSSEKVNNTATREKSKHVIQAIQFYKNFVGKAEKVCNKCGFASFSLHVLYVHKYKCQGKLMGSPLICCFCMRRFNYFSTYHRHKLTCVCSVNKKKYWQTKNYEKKLSKKKRSKSFVCVHCKKCFSDASKYKAHNAKGVCHTKLKNKNKYLSRKHSLSARKTFSTSKYDLAEDSVNLSPEMSVEDTILKDDSVCLDNTEKLLKNLFQCNNCKSLYSAKKALFEHLEKKFECAKVFYFQHSMKRREHSARKSFPIVARKSFSKSNSRLSLNRDFYGHSARKSMGHLIGVNKKQMFSCILCKGQFHSSTDFNLHKVYCHKNEPYSSSCPVCFQKFSNSFDLFQHQKIDKHWGRATKSVSFLCKCPFCKREFSNVASRNSHLNCHSDESDSVKIFLNDTTCEICSNCFATKRSKVQHMRIEHSSQSVKLRKSLCDVADWNDDNHKNGNNEIEQTDLDQSKMFKGVSFSEPIKQKMKKYPTRCPICMNSFSKIYNRNRHILSHVLECKICGLKCTKDDLKLHFQQYHRKQYEFKCIKCKKQFKNKSHALIHAARVHPNLNSKNIIFNQKETQFNSEIDMKNEEFYCDICEMSFATFYGLQRHRQSKFHRNTLTKNLDAVHESLSTLPPSSPAPDEPVKQPEILSCSECAEEFTSMIDFVPHRLSHFSSQASQSELNDLKPYTCEICNKLFDTNQRVQFHLFEHLQSRTSNENNSNSQCGISKTDPIIPDRLSGKHIAKKSFSKQDKSCSQEVVIEGVKKSLFTCDACNIGFMSKYHYTCHVRRFCKVQKSSNNNGAAVKDDNSTLDKLSAIQKNKIIQDSDDYVDSDSNYIIFDKCVLCKMCYCIFADCDLFQKHSNSYCKKCFYDNELLNNENAIFALKSVIEHDSKSCGCVRCCLPFESLRSLREHMNTHKTDMTCDSVGITDDTKQELGERKESSFKNDVSDSILPKENDKSFASVELTTNELSDDSIIKTESHYSLRKKSSLAEQSVIASIETCNSPDPSSEKVLEMLRKNFSRLLYILISDPELMEQLGYGEKIIDDVLSNVLKQMGETPFHDESGNSELDNLRKNIQILLDICLKDNIMEIIADGQTSLDNIVIEALKMLSSEEESLSPSKESQSMVSLSPAVDSSKISLSPKESKAQLSPTGSPSEVQLSPTELLSKVQLSPTKELLSPSEVSLSPKE